MYLLSLKMYYFYLFLIATDVLCPYLDQPTKGTLKYSYGVVVNSVASFKCNIGYKLVGNEKVVCLEDGTWSANIPLCQGYIIVVSLFWFMKPGYIQIYKPSFVSNNSETHINIYCLNLVILLSLCLKLMTTLA